VSLLHQLQQWRVTFVPVTLLENEPGQRTRYSDSVAYPGILFGGGGVQQIRLRTEDRENGNLGAVAPLVRGSGGSCNLVEWKRNLVAHGEAREEK